jgi:ribosomal protein S18 acetylase RimI-like enzyme
MSEQRIKIRKAVETDLSDIVNVWTGNIKTINTASDIADLFHSFEKYFFVAVYTGTAHKDTNKEWFEDEVIGFVGGAIRRGHGHISGIAVDREYRMKGVGKWLLKVVSAEFLADGFDRVTLEVRKSATGAITFYEKLGYKRSYIVKRYYADGEDAIVYEKKICAQE